MSDYRILQTSTYFEHFNKAKRGSRRVCGYLPALMNL